jgi:hypothetical protein
MTRRRDTGIDILRAIFVVVMILAHVSVLLGPSGANALSDTQLIANFACYSGFMFCFGYVAHNSFLTVNRLSTQRVLPAIVRPLIAFYISGIVHELIFGLQPLSPNEIFSILILSNLPSFSEFLVGFSLTLLVAVLLRRLVLWTTETLRHFAVCFTLLAAITLIPPQPTSPMQIALFIGSTGYVFPVVQYFPLFLLGVYFARHYLGASRWITVISAVVAIIAWILLHTNLSVINRFPPSFGWIIGSGALVLVLYAIARQLDRFVWIRRILVPIGANSLFYLLFSNLLLFGLAAGIELHFISLLDAFIATAAVIGVIYFCGSTLRFVNLNPASDTAQNEASLSTDPLSQSGLN